MKTGRPSSFTTQIGAAICERLAAGESLRAICRDETMPDRSTVVRWALADESFYNHYAAARDIGLDIMADDTLEISDENPGTIPGGGKDSAAVAHQRLRVDTRKWYLSKLAPKRYGERQAVELTGADGGAVKIEDTGAAARLAAILQAAQQRKDDIDDLV